MKPTLENDVIINQLSAVYRLKRKELADFQGKLRACEQEIDGTDKRDMTVARLEELTKAKGYYETKVAELQGFADGFYDAREVIINNLSSYRYVGRRSAQPAIADGAEVRL